MGGAAHVGSGVRRHDLTDHQPVKEHPHGGELLLDGRGRELLAQAFDPGRHMHRLDGGQGKAFAPGEELRAGAGIGGAGVRVADGNGEKLDIAHSGALARIADQGRHHQLSNPGDRDGRGLHSRKPVRANGHGWLSGRGEPIRSKLPSGSIWANSRNP
jgi:hypothetical protein